MSEAAVDVLLVEDNPGDADLVRLRLIEGNARVEVNCVDRLEAGIDSIHKKAPALVLLDLNLPDSQGAETFRKLLAKAPDVPVVILSGQNDEALAIKALHQGAQDYIVKKDITCNGLARAVRYAMERQALLRSLEISRKQQLEFKNQFLSHVSHELRTPLTCIHQYVTLLLDGLAGEVRPPQRDHLQVILRSVNQLGAMVRDLLEASRAESGKLRIEPHCLDLAGSVAAAVSMMQPPAREKGIKLASEVEKGLPLVHADPDRVLEILINLMDNAIKFTAEGGTVTVQAGRMPTDPEFVCCSVQDTGIGIGPEARPLIFERLYQDPNAIDGHRKGLGLGLFISKELVSLHGGRIWLASEPGQGSTFSFTLPLYSLAKLLLPLVTMEGRLREAMVLLRVDLKPHSRPRRGNWMELCKKSLELLQRCVYLDKDLVLPPLHNAGSAKTFLVVACTDMVRVGIMAARIRALMEKLADWKGAGSFALSATPIPLPAAELPLPEQVAEIANRVMGMVRGADVEAARKPQ